MNLTDRAQLVRLERKAFRARNAPALPAIDGAGLSTKPWGSHRISGVSPSFGRSGPSDRALDFWKRQTGGPASTRRRKRGPFALSTPAL